MKHNARDMEEVSSKLIDPNLIKIEKTLIPNSYSYDGYEQLHEEAMDKISVSVHFSDSEDVFGMSSLSVKKDSEEQEKKIKISLSQEQLKLKCAEGKNFLSVPRSSRKFRSASFSSRSTGLKLAADIPSEDFPPPPSEEYSDEVVYAVVDRMVKKEHPVNFLGAPCLAEGLTPLHDLVSQASSTTLSHMGENSRSFKYSLSLHCQVCNNILSDPRTLDCLHTFCFDCLRRLDASNDLHNNQFWRKASVNSETSCEDTKL